MSIRILGTGSALPENIITNDDLAKIVDTSDEWIRERTGICERHVAKKESTVSLAAEAARKALENAGVTADSVELIIVATATPDNYFPCTACEVHGIINAKNATAFDLSAACTGFLFALNTAQAYIKSGIYKNALIIGADVLSKVVDWSDRTTCVLFGDGAGAVYIEAADSDINIVQGADGARGSVLSCVNRRSNYPFDNSQEAKQYMYMDGQEVYKFAVRQVPQCINEVLNKSGVNKDEVKYFVLHQANIRIIESVAKRLDVSMDKFPTNLSKVGNISAASIPILLDMLNRENKLCRGDKLVLSGFGAGLTYGAAIIEW